MIAMSKNDDTHDDKNSYSNENNYDDDIDRGSDDNDDDCSCSNIKTEDQIKKNKNVVQQLLDKRILKYAGISKKTPIGSSK